MPKAGTNLLSKALSLFPGIFWKRGYIEGSNILSNWMRFLLDKNSRRKTHIGYSSVDPLKQAKNSDENFILIGIDRPQQVSIKYLQDLLRGMIAGSFVTGHIPFSMKMANLLEDFGVRSLLILRDPRDVVISHANYVAKKQSHFLFDDYQKLSKSEQIMHSIIGISNYRQDVPLLLNISDRYRSIVPWRSVKSNYTTFFEKLVGPRGKGSYNDQIEELENISHHLGIKYSLEDLEMISVHLYGGTATFQKGTIGNWKNYFSDEHKHAFKDIAGDLLIELGYENNNNW